jgi:carboxymethylenebutenolidase
MCFDLNSEPPIFGQPSTQATGDRLVLNSADGATFLAFLAKPANPSGAGVLVLPDNRGLYNFYEQLTLRLAEQGHVAIAIDYFGRSAGTEVRGKDFPLMKHLMQLTRQGLDHDIETAAKFLR